LQGNGSKASPTPGADFDPLLSDQFPVLIDLLPDQAAISITPPPRIPLSAAPMAAPLQALSLSIKAREIWEKKLKSFILIPAIV
jgi:hypothetical protein